MAIKSKVDSPPELPKPRRRSVKAPNVKKRFGILPVSAALVTGLVGGYLVNTGKGKDMGSETLAALTSLHGTISSEALSALTSLRGSVDGVLEDLRLKVGGIMEDGIETHHNATRRTRYLLARHEKRIFAVERIVGKLSKDISLLSNSIARLEKRLDRFSILSKSSYSKAKSKLSRKRKELGRLKKRLARVKLKSPWQDRELRDIALGRTPVIKARRLGNVVKRNRQAQYVQKTVRQR